MSRTPESSMTDLGGRVGVLLRERGNAVVAPTIQLEKVVAGAGRRRRRSRIAASTLCLALAVGAGFLVTQRVPQADPAQQPPAADRPVLELYATLDGYEPQAAFARQWKRH